MEYIDLRKVGREGLKEIRRQVVRLKKLGKKLAASWLEHHKDKIEVFFLPPYAPEYNPDEYLNHTLKISVHCESEDQRRPVCEDVPAV